MWCSVQRLLGAQVREMYVEIAEAYEAAEGTQCEISGSVAGTRIMDVAPYTFECSGADVTAPGFDQGV